MKYKHIVFDVDGTLIDNEKVILLSLQKAILQVERKFFELDDLRFILGIPGTDALIKLNLSNPSLINVIWGEKYQEFSHETQLFNGISDVLLELKNYYSIGIITSKTNKEFVEEVEHKFPSIMPYLNFKVCADDTKLHKPNSEPMYFYMNCTNTKPGEILYIGDTIYDYKCANGAGVDFGLAVWGSKITNISPTYYFNHPNDILKLLANLN